MTTHNEIDIHVANRMRFRRKIMKMSQAELAERIGVTVQQVRKYELNRNRIGCGRLYHITEALEVPMEYFFEGLEPLPRRENIDRLQSIAEELMHVVHDLRLE